MRCVGMGRRFHDPLWASNAEKTCVGCDHIAVCRETPGVGVFLAGRWRPAISDKAVRFAALILVDETTGPVSVDADWLPGRSEAWRTSAHRNDGVPMPSDGVWDRDALRQWAFEVLRADAAEFDRMVYVNDPKPDWETV